MKITFFKKYSYYLLSGFIFLVGCTASKPPVELDISDEIDGLLVTALSDIQDYYITDTNLTHLSLSGLENIDNYVKEINFSRLNKDINFQINHQIIASATLPVDENDVEELAFVLAQFIEDTKKESSGMARFDDDEIINILFDGILSPLDKFSRYSGPSQASSERDSREGFGGIGVGLGPHTKGAIVETVNAGDPADAAGIHQGDIIVAIDGIITKGTPVKTIKKLLRGPEDQAVVVHILRSGLEKPLEMDVGRKHIVPNTVFYRLEAGHPIIRLSGFNQRTAKRMAEAVSHAQRDADLAETGLILDLRDNPGGLLDQAIDTADLFLNSGVIIQINGRNPLSDQLFFAESGDISAGAPLVLLINGASASAAEILATALQDHGRAIVVGSNSFGKGSVQNVLSMPNTGELILTWAHFQSPHNYPLNEFGVLPNVCTSRLDQDWASNNSTLNDDILETVQSFKSSRQELRDVAPSATDFRRLCPWHAVADNEVELELAKYLLDDQAIYIQVLHNSTENNGS